MKKNIQRILALLCLTALLLSLAACGRTENAEEEGNKPAPTEQTDRRPDKEQRPAEELKETEEPAAKPDREEAPAEEKDEPQEKKPVEAKPVSLKDALFIGDSRTVGLMEYSGAEADFFATVGMSVYNIHDDAVAVPNVGRVTLEELLGNKNYGKIYVMLGINEVGYNQDQTIGEYEDLVKEIQKAQPDADVYLQANLHVSRESSENSEYVTNERLDSLNRKIEKLAARKGIHYLDINSQFDDASGALDAEATSDGIHPYAKYYVQWGEWIARETASL